MTGVQTCALPISIFSFDDVEITEKQDLFFKCDCSKEKMGKALILQVFYNYVLAKIEALTSEMEDSSISLLDMVIKYDLKYKK